MQFLANIFDKMRPSFEEGGKFSTFYTLFEALETFHLTSPKVTKNSPHLRDSIDMKRLMIFVVIALGPCVLFGIYNAGHQSNLADQVADATLLADLIRGLIVVLPIIMTSYIVGGIWEVLFAIVRKHEISEGFLVTGLLFPLVLPPTIPLWQVAVAISFGTIIGKEVFGGSGYNILNPALTARVFLFFAYPGQITGDSVWVKSADGVTGATPLAFICENNAIEALQTAGYTFKNMFLGLQPGSIGETSLIPILIGALILLVTKIGSWRIMLSGLIGLTVTALMISDVPFYYHYVMGGFAFGIVFMATDPVSGASTKLGKWIYGFLIGFLTVLIRVVNPAFPEGAMLSILFMNVMSPTIDHFVVAAHIKRRTRNWRNLDEK